MPILKKLYETKTTRQHKAYQKYYKEAKAKGIKKPLTFKMWAGSWPGSKGVASVKPRKLYKRKKKQPPKETAASLLVDYARRRSVPKRKK